MYTIIILDITLKLLIYKILLFYDDKISCLVSKKLNLLQIIMQHCMMPVIY